MTDDYATAARYYDEGYAAKSDLDDLSFYLDLAKRQGGPVLEIACGTGRILLPTARAGIAIDGIDGSGAMLAVLQGKIREESEPVRRRVSVRRADMRSFDLGKRYRLVTIPFRPMQHMHTLDDQLAALAAARRHLLPEGLLAFNVFFPDFGLMASGLGQEQLDLEWVPRDDPGKMVRRFFVRESHDKIRQRFVGALIYRTFEGERLVREDRQALTMSYYTYPHLRLLFRSTGLEVVEEYGSFGRTPLDNGAREMIFVLKPA